MAHLLPLKSGQEWGEKFPIAMMAGDIIQINVPDNYWTQIKFRHLFIPKQSIRFHLVFSNQNCLNLNWLLVSLLSLSALHSSPSHSSLMTAFSPPALPSLLLPDIVCGSFSTFITRTSSPPHTHRARIHIIHIWERIEGICLSEYMSPYFSNPSIFSANFIISFFFTAQ